MKYYVKLESGRDFVFEGSEDVEQAAYDALDEAWLMDDYLVDMEPIDV